MAVGWLTNSQPLTITPYALGFTVIAGPVPVVETNAPPSTQVRWVFGFVIVAAIFLGVWLYLLNLRHELVGTPGGVRMLIS